MLDFYRVDQVLGTPETVWGFLGKLVPVGTFVLGIVANRGFARYDKTRKDRKVTQDLITEIELLEEPMRMQQEAIKDFVEKLRSDTGDMMVFSSYLSLNIDRLNALDRSSLTDHLDGPMKGRKKAMDTANMILAGCEAVTRKYTEVRRTVSDYAVNSQAILDRCQEKVNHFDRLVGGYVENLHHLNISESEDTLLNEINKFANPNLRLDRKNVRDLFEHHFKPLEGVWPKYFIDPRTSHLRDASRAIRECVYSLMDEQNSTANRLEIIADFMKTDFDSLQAAVRLIPSSK